LILAAVAITPLLVAGLAGGYAHQRYRAEEARLSRVAGRLEQAGRLLAEERFDEADRCLSEPEAELAGVPGWISWTALDKQALALRKLARAGRRCLEAVWRQEEVLRGWSEGLQETHALWSKGELKQADRALRRAEKELARHADCRLLPALAGRRTQAQRKASDLRWRIDESFHQQQVLFVAKALLAEANGSLDRGAFDEADRILRQAEAELARPAKGGAFPALRQQWAKIRKQCRAQRKQLEERRSGAELVQRTRP
jgi:hypothetical protein